jgi:hypothetical protein
VSGFWMMMLCDLLQVFQCRRNHWLRGCLNMVGLLWSRSFSGLLQKLEKVSFV